MRISTTRCGAALFLASVFGAYAIASPLVATQDSGGATCANVVPGGSDTPSTSSALSQVRDLTLSARFDEALQLLSDQRAETDLDAALFDLERARVESLRGGVEAGRTALMNALEAQAGAGTTRILHEATALLSATPSMRTPQIVGDLFERAKVLHAAASNDLDRIKQAFVLGSTYAWSEQYTQSAAWAREGITGAQALSRPDLEYEAADLLGAVLSRGGDREGALLAYEIAMDAFDRGRGTLLSSARIQPGGFRGHGGRAFLGYASLLLTGSADDATLWRAITILERLKSAELSEYFLSSCDTAPEPASPRTLAERLPASTALLYPIVLPDRTVVLSVREGKIAQWPAGSSVDLDDRVRAFRDSIDSSDTERQLVLGRELDGALVPPPARDAETLLIVADGPVRLLPWSALHDGERYLIERAAVVTAPALVAKLPAVEQSRDLVIAGLTEAVQGFPALPAVEREISQLEGTFARSSRMTLIDGEFEVGALEQAIDDVKPSILHIATHGEIGPRADKSFLLTYRGRLALGELDSLVGSRRGAPFDLITLSACQTAVGDDRAALGLGGVALKAGSQRVLATLWQVSDVATSRAMDTFYGAYAADPNAAPQALRKAQLALLAASETRQPRFWAPFVLVERI